MSVSDSAGQRHGRLNRVILLSYLLRRLALAAREGAHLLRRRLGAQPHLLAGGAARDLDPEGLRRHLRRLVVVAARRRLVVGAVLAAVLAAAAVALAAVAALRLVALLAVRAVVLLDEGVALLLPPLVDEIDITFVGYVTNLGNGGPLTKRSIFDATGTSCDTGGSYQGCAIYHGSDNRLYLRFKPSSLYHIAFSVDSMYVGNGYVLKRNDIEVVVDPSATL